MDPNHSRGLFLRFTVKILKTGSTPRAQNEAKQKELHERHVLDEKRSKQARLRQSMNTYAQRRQAVVQQRQESLQKCQEVEQMKASDVESKQDQAKIVREQLHRAKQKRDADREKILQRNKEEYEQRMRLEEQEAIKAERAVQLLVQKELECIEKLRQAQTIQTGALVQAEAALRSDPPPRRHVRKSRVTSTRRRSSSRPL